jgi:hypothetical protein
LDVVFDFGSTITNYMLLLYHHHAAGHGNKTQKGTGVIDKLGEEEEAVKKMHSQEYHVKELKATIMDLKAENAKLKIALDSARSQGKV